MPCFKRDGHLVVTPQSFLCFVGDHWPHAQVLPLASIYLRAVWTVGNEITAFSLSCFVGLALVLRRIETAGAWPERLPDAYIAFPTVTGSYLRGSARPTFTLWCTVFGLLSGSGINKAGFTLRFLFQSVVLVKRVSSVDA